MKDCIFSNSDFYDEIAKASNVFLEVNNSSCFMEKWIVLSKLKPYMVLAPHSNDELGLSSSDICDTWEAIGENVFDNGLLLAAGTHLWAVIKPILDFGSEEQKKQWLPKLLDGSIIGGYAASEEDAGSDIMSLQTSYRVCNESYVINGKKMWTTNAPYADIFIVFATSDTKLHYRGISAFLIPKNTPGITIGTPDKNMGLNSASISSVYFNNCVVPKTALLGKHMRASEIFQSTLLWERTFILAPWIGTMRRQIKDAITYSNKRMQFGKKIGKFQAISHRIAIMYSNYWQARQVFRKAAYEIVHNNNGSLASVANLVISNMAVETHLEALKCYGATGYTKGMQIEEDVRDALACQIYSGTADIQRNIIAGNIGL